MKPFTHLKNPLVIWACILALPPLGLILLWMKRDFRPFVKLLGTLMAVIMVALHLHFFWGLHIEANGGMSRPIFTFRNTRKHDREIEKLHREEHSIDASRLTAPPPIATPPAPEAATEEVKVKPAADAEPVSARPYWTDYRGPGRTGMYDQAAIRTEWPSGRLPLVWKRPVGGGYASMVIAGGVLFTIEQRREREVVAAYDLGTGREKWIHGWEAAFREVQGGDGPRATPVWHEGRIYALGATGELRCLDARSGSRIWSLNILSDNDAENLPWGMAASPLIVDDKVVVLPGGPDGKSVAAYDKRTGGTVWKSLDDRQAYAAPQLVTLAGRRQILVVSATRLMGIAPEDGALLWEHPWASYSGINAAQPIVTAENRVYVSAGYDQGAALLEISPAGSAFEARVVWRNRSMKNRFNSSVLHEGFIYGFDEAILACIDADTGERRWKGGRYGYGQVLLASGRLVIASETGEVALVRAVPEKHEEIYRFPALEGKTWNVPAISDGYLIVRNAAEMACFRIAQ